MELYLYSLHMPSWCGQRQIYIALQYEKNLQIFVKTRLNIQDTKMRWLPSVAKRPLVYRATFCLGYLVICINCSLSKERNKRLSQMVIVEIKRSNDTPQCKI